MRDQNRVNLIIGILEYIIYKIKEYNLILLYFMHDIMQP